MIRNSLRARARGPWARPDVRALVASLLLTLGAGGCGAAEAAGSPQEASRKIPRVDAGPRDPARAAPGLAVIRGQISAPDGSRVAGVRIAVLDHPEYGSTRTRADGTFDLAVSGDRCLTVTFQKDGYLPVQRQVRSGGATGPGPVRWSPCRPTPR